MVSGQSRAQLERSLNILGAELQSAALAPATATKYRAVWGQWSAWCQFFGFSVWLTGSGSTNSRQLGAFAAYCNKYGFQRSGNSGNRGVTVLSKLSAVRWAHRHYLGLEPELGPSFNLLAQGL